MGTHVLLLRGINLGSTNAVSMSDLRELITGLGHTAVRTHLRSGNVVLSADLPPDELAARVEDAIAGELGLKVPAAVRTRDELAEIVAGNPIPGAVADPARFLVMFLSAEPDPVAVRAVDPDDHHPDQFAVRGRELYQWSPNGVSKTKLTTSFWEQRLNVTATARNWNTVTKLLAMLDD